MGHIALAYISRSDKEPIFSTGIFTNKIINIWAASAIIFLLSCTYIPILNYRFNFAKIGIYSIIYVVIFMMVIIGTLEAMKYLRKKTYLKLPTTNI
jgi:Ca2+-transporting ATPase